MERGQLNQQHRQLKKKQRGAEGALLSCQLLSVVLSLGRPFSLPLFFWPVVVFFYLALSISGVVVGRMRRTGRIGRIGRTGRVRTKEKGSTVLWSACYYPITRDAERVTIKQNKKENNQCLHQRYVKRSFHHYCHDYHHYSNDQHYDDMDDDDILFIFFFQSNKKKIVPSLT